MTHLVPLLVEHDSATYRYPGLVRQETLEGLFVVVSPVAEKRADVEQAVGEPLEGHCWKTGVLFSNKVFIVPVPGENKSVKCQSSFTTLSH